MSRSNGGEKYIKSFDGYTHLLTMLFAVIMRFDSLREIETAMTSRGQKTTASWLEKGAQTLYLVRCKCQTFRKVL